MKNFCPICGIDRNMVGYSHRCIPKPDPIEDVARERDAAPSKGLRIKSVSKSRSAEAIGDGVALTSMAHPDGLIDKMADAIKSGKLTLKRGRPRIGEPKPPKHEPWKALGLSERTYYRRQKEGKL